MSKVHKSKYLQNCWLSKWLVKLNTQLSGMSLVFSLNTPSCSLLCVWFPFPPWHQQEFCGCLQPLFLSYWFYFSESQEGTEASEKATEPLCTEVSAFCGHSSRSCTLASVSLDTPAIIPCHLPAEGTEALVRPAHLPCRNGKRVWCGNHAVGSTAQGCVAPKYLSSPPKHVHWGQHLTPEVPSSLHVLSSCVRPVQVANSSSVSMAKLPSFMALPHCGLNPSKRGSLPGHGYLFKGQVTFLISLSGF